MKILLRIVVILSSVFIIILIIGYALPVSHVVSRSRLFETDSREIWEIVINVKEYPLWRKDVQGVEILKNNNWKEVDMNGQKIEYKLEIIEPAKKWKTTIMTKDIPFGGFWDYQLEDQDGFCKLTIRENGEIYNPFFRFFSRFILGDNSIDNYFDSLKLRVAEDL